jgi:hypothetical protein
VLADESLKSLHLAPIEPPLMLVDVDGVISLFGFDPSRPPEGRFELVDGIAHFISATAGKHLCTHVGSVRSRLVHRLGGEGKRISGARARAAGLPDQPSPPPLRP